MIKSLISYLFFTPTFILPVKGEESLGFMNQDKILGCET